MKKISILAVFVCLSFFANQVSSANPDTPAQNLTLSPVKQRLELKAGEVYSGSFHLLNAGKTAYDLKVYAGPYSVKDESYTVDFESKKPNSDIEGWVQFRKSKHHLEPNTSIDVAYTLTIPKNARPGGHYGVLFAETLENPSTKPNFGVSSTQRLGMLAYIVVDGNYGVGGNIKTQDIPFFQLNKPLTSKTRIENTGNVDFDTSQQLTVSDFLGNVKYSTKKDYSVLPGTIRAVDLNWDSVPAIGLFKVSVSTKFLTNSTQIDRYVLMAPLWFYFAMVVLILVSITAWVIRKR